MRGSWLALSAVVVLGSAGLIAACGSSGDPAVFTDDSGAGDGTSPIQPGDDSGNIFGGDSSSDGSPTTCTPKTCQQLGVSCGPQGDGCGNIIQCGDCTAPQTCGGGGTPSVCGGTAACIPKTCQQLNATCGAQGDGCGGVIATCGTCTAPQICGGAVPNQCGGLAGGDGGSCLPTKTTCAPGDCGFISNGCGNVLNCGACTAPAICGFGGSSVCGVPDGGVTCTPKTCAQLGVNCGQVADGCGGLTVNCGACTAPQYCGGGGNNICGPTSVTGCDGGTTTLTGYVFDPANNLPVYNALVYVPTGPVQPPQTGVVPTQCGCTAPQAYASAFTGIDGKFTLTNPPTGAAVTVVVQLGKWQRTFTKAIACGPNPLGGGTVGAAGNLTLPSTHLEGNIPRFAIDTGNVDSMECVLLKMGIKQSEFVNPVISGGLPTAVQRVHMYKGSIVSGGAVVDGATPGESALTETASVMNAYDVVLFPCQGGAGTYNAANGFPNTRTNLLNYSAVGGRFFTTHFHYDLLNGNGSFSTTANWTLNNGSWGDLYSDPKYTGIIDQTFSRGQTLALWLNQPIVYGGTAGQIPVGVIRNDFSSVNAPAQRWMYTGGGGGGPPANLPIHYTFDTPYKAAQSCGRAVYSDFHVESEQTNAGTNGATFPTECPAGAMTPQEKLLEFMLFDLTSCVSPPACVPKTCAQQGITCGPAGDGCGGVIASCGVCVGSQTCGGGGPGICGGPVCTPKTCAQQGYNCGKAGDGCGGQIDCGTCTVAGQVCGGGGANQCGTVSCTPTTCAKLGVACGPVGDGCGNIIQCGPCTAPDTCGGGGTPGQCGHPNCTKTTCAAQNATCGPISDGCGGILDCGTCVAPATCGGGGVSNQCGGGIR